MIILDKVLSAILRYFLGGIQGSGQPATATSRLATRSLWLRIEARLSYRCVEIKCQIPLRLTTY